MLFSTSVRWAWIVIFLAVPGQASQFDLEFFIKVAGVLPYPTNQDYKVTKRNTSIIAQRNGPFVHSAEDLRGEIDNDIYSLLGSIAKCQDKSLKHNKYGTFPPRGYRESFKKSKSHTIHLNKPHLSQSHTREFSEGMEDSSIGTTSFTQIQFASRIIYHAHNMTMNDIEKILPSLKAQGYTHVLTSPLQSCISATHNSQNLIERDQWWLRYQPLDFAAGNCLGSPQEIGDLIKKAEAYGIHIYTDIVCNHLAGIFGLNHSQWEAAYKEPFVYRTMLLRLKQYENFSMARTLKRTDRNWENLFVLGDPEAWQLCMEDFYPWCEEMSDGTRRYSWFMSALPKLKGSKNVLKRVTSYVKELKLLGVSGVRIDAADHLDNDIYTALTQCLEDNKMTFFLEIASGNIDDHKKYLQKGPTTHYPFLHRMAEIFSLNGSLANLIQTNFSVDKHIKFAETHDTHASRQMDNLGISAGIADKTDRKLATCYLNAQHGGSVLILNTEATTNEIIASVKFRSLLERYKRHKKRRVNHLEHIYMPNRNCDKRNVSIMKCHDGAGIVFMNKSVEEYEIDIWDIPVANDTEFTKNYVEIKVTLKKSLLKKSSNNKPPENSSNIFNIHDKEVFFEGSKETIFKIPPRSARFFVLKKLIRLKKRKYGFFPKYL